jgi:Nif-specific regulatory protein
MSSLQTNLPGSSHFLNSLNEQIFFGELSRLILEQTKEFGVRIFLAYSDESTQLIALNGKGLEGTDVLAKGRGISGYIVKTKRSYFSNQVKRDPLYALEGLAQEVEAECAIPMIVDGVVIGTIHIQSATADRKFDEKDVVDVKNLLKDYDLQLMNMKLYLAAKFLNRELMAKLSNHSQVNANDAKNLAKTEDNIQILGRTQGILEALNIAKRVSREDYPVLLEGESGVGKRSFAKKIHLGSNRAQSNLCVVECSLGEEKLLEAELFGEGSRLGAVEMAQGGVLLLNDVGDLPARLQLKIVNMMISGTYSVDGDETKKLVNVRVIATTKKSLIQNVRDGKFRDDLYYRLSTAHIKIPALRERKDDIQIIAEHLLNDGKKEKKHLTNTAIEGLLDHAWKGNIIELRNIMERAYALADGKYIETVDIPDREAHQSADKALKVDPVKFF